MNSVASLCSQGGAHGEGPPGPAVAVREPDGAGGGEEVGGGEHGQTDRGQVGPPPRSCPFVIPLLPLTPLYPSPADFTE